MRITTRNRLIIAAGYAIGAVVILGTLSLLGGCESARDTDYAQLRGRTVVVKFDSFENIQTFKPGAVAYTQYRLNPPRITMLAPSDMSASRWHEVMLHELRHVIEGEFHE